MPTIDTLGQTGSLGTWGDGTGGFYGQSFVAQGTSLDQVQFRIASWQQGTTDYRIVVTTFANNSVGTIIGMSDLMTVSAAGLQTINLDGIDLVPGATYAFLLDTTYGVQTTGRASIESSLSNANPYSDGVLFYNHREVNGEHVLGPVTTRGTQDFGFKLVFDAAPTPVVTNGTVGNDVFTATSDAPQVYNGDAGNDTITTLGGNDTLTGGAGTDTISSGGGDDTIVFSGNRLGADVIDGGAGTDSLVAAAANTVIGLQSITGIERISSEGFVNVTIAFTGAAETFDFSGIALQGIAAIDLGGGNDTFIGTGLADNIVGASGNDTLAGGGGDDRFLFSGGSGTDTIDGGTGYDTIAATAANATLNWGSYSNVEAISGGGFAGVKILGTGATDIIDLSGYAVSDIASIDGGAGNDLIVGSEGNDTIIGSTGDDTLYGNGGDDVFLFNATSGTDTINGGDGYDTIRATADNSLLRWGAPGTVEEISAGGFAGVKIVGAKGDDVIDLTGITLTGIAAIEGSNGNDTIIGSTGRDVIVGGVGADILSGGEGVDIFRYATVAESRASTGIDRITDFIAQADKIDLSAIDANTSLAGKQDFTFIGDDAFSGAKGELRYAWVNGDTHVLADLDGNKVADIQIVLSEMLTLTSGDFFLGA